MMNQLSLAPSDPGQEDARPFWRPIGRLASAWADRVAVVRLARAAAVPDADLAAHFGLAAE